MSLNTKLSAAEQDRELDRLWSAAWPSSVPTGLRYPHGHQPITEYLRAWAKLHPDKPAIIFYGKVVTFGELDLLSDRFARLLIDRGVRKGDRVVVKTRSGEVMAKVLARRTSGEIELLSINPEHPNRNFSLGEVEWLARIVWASQ